MYINPAGYNHTSNFRNNNMTFARNPKKQLIQMLASENLDKFKITFDEAKRICEMLGHTVEYAPGSHAKIRAKDNKGTLTIVIPHKAERFLSIVDKKKLIYLFTGRFEDAFRMR